MEEQVTAASSTKIKIFQLNVTSMVAKSAIIYNSTKAAEAVSSSGGRPEFF